MSGSLLSVIAPTTITDTQFISCTSAENDYAAYNPATTYAASAAGALVRVISTTTHRIYESLRSGNIGHDPTDINNRIGTTPWWLDFGPTNIWAPFDTEVSTAVTAASTITYVLKPGAFDAIYFGGMDGTSIDVVVKDNLSGSGGVQVYHYAGSLEGSAPDDYWEYFFDPFKPLKDLLLQDIPPYTLSELTITIVGGNLKCGVIAIGALKTLGNTQYGAKAKPKTFSYIKTDDYGKNKIIKRKSAKDMSVSTFLAIDEADFVVDLVTSLLDTPCVWIASNLDGYGGLRTFGLGSGELSYDFFQDCQLTINVQGLI